MLGAFWSTQHAKDSIVMEEKVKAKFDEEPTNHIRHSPPREENSQTRSGRGNVHITKSHNRSEEGPSKDFEIMFDSERPRTSKPESTPAFQNETFNAFVAEFDTSKLNSGIDKEKEQAMEVEVKKLKEQLKQTNLEKAEITSKFEKLSAICRSQRQEIQELKQSLAAGTPSPNRDASKNQTLSGVKPSTATQREKIEGTVWELNQGSQNKNSASPDPKSWQPFADDSKPKDNNSNPNRSARTRNGHQNNPNPTNMWGFGTESFTASPVSSAQISRPTGEGNTSQRFGDSKKMESQLASQPAGWAGF